MKSIITSGILLLGSSLMAVEYHVAVTGRNAQDGSAGKPLATIQAAAELAQPGDTITVHAGTYRERINPPRGGESDARRITYRAAPGEQVVITGAEIVKHWERVTNDTWMVTLPDSFFAAFNPYQDPLHGDWFARGHGKHPGAVYLNGAPLYEAARLVDVLKPAGPAPVWFGQVDPAGSAGDSRACTTIWAQFKGVDPNAQTVEINVRQSVFYPDKPGRNYITVRGFTLERAATPWAPPTAEQIGLIGTHWSRGWIIERNVIRHSKCAGLTLGKYGDEFDNKSESAEGFLATIRRALTNGWNRATIGSHIVRDNDISRCEQAGIVGSLGAVFSTITGNNIHDLHVMDEFWGYEVAGIKLHGAVDCLIANNHIYRTEGGIWMDWLLQGTRISGNLLHDNRVQDLSFEVDHGPVVVDNNLFLSPQQAQLRVSQGCAFIHNLNAWSLWPVNPPDARQTPYLKPHSTGIAGLHDNPCGDTRYYHNLCVQRTDLSPYDAATLPVAMAGNVFLHGAKPSRHEPAALVLPNFDPAIKVIEKADGWYLELALDPAWAAAPPRRLVTTELLGKAVVSDQAFVNPDGSPLKVDTDYLGRKRDVDNPFPGPFEIKAGGHQTLKVWPKP